MNDVIVKVVESYMKDEFDVVTHTVATEKVGTTVQSILFSTKYEFK